MESRSYVDEKVTFRAAGDPGWHCRVPTFDPRSSDRPYQGCQPLAEKGGREERLVSSGEYLTLTRAELDILLSPRCLQA